jgi:hypothetical protein
MEIELLFPPPKEVKYGLPMELRKPNPTTAKVVEIFSQTEHKICQSLTKLIDSQVIVNENIRKPRDAKGRDEIRLLPDS